MNKLEMGKVLTVAAGFDLRRVDDLTVTAWMEVLGGYDYETVRQAVVDHHRDPVTRHDYLTVGHVLDRVERAVRARSADVEADVRSAKARGLVDRSWPRAEPLPVDVAEKLRAAREAAREEVALHANVLSQIEGEK